MSQFRAAASSIAVYMSMPTKCPLGATRSKTDHRVLALGTVPSVGSGFVSGAGKAVVALGPVGAQAISPAGSLPPLRPQRR
jgi:hypothetical protein